MKRLLTAMTALGLFVLCARAVPAVITAEADRLIASGGSSAAGRDDGPGVWAIAVGRAAMSEFSEADARIVAALNARRELGAFLEARVAAETEAAESVGDGKEMSYFSTWTRETVAAKMKGAVIERTVVKDGMATAVAVMTERSADATGRLQAAMMRSRPGTVAVSGEGATREDAVQAACRSALEQVCGTSVAASDTVTDGEVRRRVFTDVQGLVSAYRILKEEKTGSGVRVDLVAEVSKDELQENYGARMKSVGDPLFWIVSPDSEDAGAAISDFLMEKGLKTTVSKDSADYCVRLVCDFIGVKHPYTGKPGTQLHMKAVCFDKGGVQLFAVENDPRRASGFLSSPERQRRLTVRKAVSQMKEPLHRALQRAVSDMTNNGRTVRMVFRNTTLKPQCDLIERITDLINNGLPGATAATYSRNDTVCSATVRFTLKGNPQDFLSALRARVPECPAALTVSANKIVFEF